MASADRPRRRWRLEPVELAVLAAVVASCVAYACTVPATSVWHPDHLVFLRTLQRMRGGEAFYPAFRDAMHATGIVVGRARAFRLPLFFEIMRWVPPSLLHPAYYAVVVVGTAFLVLRLSSQPLAAFTVAVYLTVVGQAPIGGGIFSDWMLVELWTVPLLAGALLAHRNRRWWLAAILVGVAALFREVNAPLLLGGALYAYRHRLPLRPWIATFGAFLVAFTLHLQLASGYVLPHGNDAPLLGTAHFPGSLLRMLDWPVMPAALAVVIWIVAWWHAAKLGILDLVAPMLAIPLLGILADRPYWGYVVMPFAIMWSTEVAVAAIRRFVERGGTTGAGSSPPARTPARGRRTPAVAPAPSSARS